MFGNSVHGEEGEVTSIQGNKATVKIQASKGCERCRLCTRISDAEMTIQANTIKPVNIGTGYYSSICIYTLSPTSYCFSSRILCGKIPL
jgi:hypothetical protein